LSLCEEYETSDADIIVSAFGITGRFAKSAVRRAREKGIAAGLIRPITLWPFPTESFAAAAQTADQMLVVEMNYGQMLEDVRLATNCSCPIEFLGKGGGWYPTAEIILEKIESMAAQRALDSKENL
jgi:2-oxoglutarate ferredoxin oxidoreductase subunit alpha